MTWRGAARLLGVPAFPEIWRVCGFSPTDLTIGSPLARGVLPRLTEQGIVSIFIVLFACNNFTVQLFVDIFWVSFNTKTTSDFRAVLTLPVTLGRPLGQLDPSTARLEPTLL